ncbi:hypothetical protein GPECTOR_973g240 [Gonium pectorale]|uniref:Uncharacterized protein n=1 Tax=Gonium pectorale TaxID=33097 RepID=A0A150FTR4_GONPE|nr:hypothetical protein GPECTOR_973g240 [Gonium pectorale]|eukprot:KXZ41017.1 hypothetical protein GPECTOR_973g240 [Gonium pectorale]
MDLALADSTRRRMADAVAELQAWLEWLGEGYTLANVGPELLLVYISEHWLPRHPGRKREEYMWESAQRGKDTGSLRLSDFVFPDQPRVVDTRLLNLPPPFLWAAGSSYAFCVREQGTKTYRTVRAPAVYLNTREDWALCFPRTFAYYLWRCRQVDVAGCAVVDYLFRPLTPDHRSFKEEPLSSQALGARIQTHLRAAELYEGEANHSFRRGVLQAAEAGGSDAAALLTLGQMRSEQTLKRYLAPERHLGRPTGRGGARAAGGDLGAAGGGAAPAGGGPAAGRGRISGGLGRRGRGRRGGRGRGPG